MKINPAMVVLARELRGLTQSKLAALVGIGQARISKIEGGLQNDPPDALVQMLAERLRVPVEFLQQEEELLGVGSSAYYYRKKADLTAADRDRIHALVNVSRIHLKKLLRSVELEATRSLPRIDLDDYGGSPAKAAQAVRAFWNLPNGPIKNLTQLVESAGVIVVPCDFQTRAMDATSMRLANMPPLVFINSDVPGDRWRFTLAHELAHLILHDMPHESMEAEADQFAAEFLMPEVDIRAQFQRMQPLKVQELVTLKPFWRTSMGALLKRAGDLGYLTDVQKSRLWSTMAKLGWRTKEPEAIAKEAPTTLQKLTSFFKGTLSYNVDEMGRLLVCYPEDVKLLCGEAFASPEAPVRPSLRVV